MPGFLNCFCLGSWYARMHVRVCPSPQAIKNHSHKQSYHFSVALYDTWNYDYYLNYKRGKIDEMA